MDTKSTGPMKMVRAHLFCGEAFIKFDERLSLGPLDPENDERFRADLGRNRMLSGLAAPGSSAGHGRGGSGVLLTLHPFCTADAVLAAQSVVRTTPDPVVDVFPAAADADPVASLRSAHLVVERLDVF